MNRKGAESSSTNEMAARFALKAALRKSMNKSLRALSEEELAKQSLAVTRQLIQQPFFKEARNVGCYLSMGKGELRTGGIVEECLRSDKKLYIPYLPPAAATATAAGQSDPPTMDMLRLYSLEDMHACPLDKWGILDPSLNRRDVEGRREDVLSAEAEDLDLILIPGVAFDADCNRLGRGKAYYDRFLANYTLQRKSPLLVALALSCQVLPQKEAVPTTPNDFQLDGVLSPEGVVWRTGREPGM